MENPKSRKRLLLVAGTLLLLAALILIGIYVQTQPQRLYPEEIREYEGQDLSSISDVRENAIRGNQHVDQSTYRLTVTGFVNRTKEYTYEQVVGGFQDYEKIVTLHCIEGWSVMILWKGVLVRDLLHDVGVNSTAKVVIFHASDGYTTSFPLEYFYDNDVLIAYEMNGLTLPPERGFPFQLVAESKYGYKWIKWITQIELSDDESYRGYWESRGYSNDADVP
jgi:DMSO/TMAO reductase YedYZ molybdopterin-dependent catalytic subunit